MNVAMYPRYGTILCIRIRAGRTGGGKRLTGRLLKNHARAVAIKDERFAASRVWSLRTAITGGGSHLIRKD